MLAHNSVAVFSEDGRFAQSACFSTSVLAIFILRIKLSIESSYDRLVRSAISGDAATCIAITKEMNIRSFFIGRREIFGAPEGFYDESLPSPVEDGFYIRMKRMMRRTTTGRSFKKRALRMIRCKRHIDIQFQL